MFKHIQFVGSGQKKVVNGGRTGVQRHHIVINLCMNWKKAGAKMGALMIWLQLGIAAVAQDSMTTKTAMQQVIRKSGRAAVKAFAFDTAQQMQTGGPFSAVVVTADGYLLTVAHASRPGKTYKISFPDGRFAIAVGMGRIDLDAQETLPDIAVMKILDAGPWPFAEMASSAGIRQGDPCMMIAYPESTGLPLPSIRYGRVTDPRDQHGFVVSDCTMEVGDSGGPVFDMDGRVIGLNSRCQAAESLNYHVPVDAYRKHWSALTRQQNYTQYPGVDSGWAVSLPPAIVPLPPAQMLRIQEGSAVALTSRMQGRTSEIAGTVWKTGAQGTWILSKHSAVGDTVFLKTGKGKKIRLQVAARNPENDLVLLTTKKKTGGVGVSGMEKNTGEPELSSFLYVPLPGGGQKRGVVSTGSFDMPARMSSGYFGAKLAEMEHMVGVAFTDPQGPAARNGILAGDKLLRINDVQPANSAAFIGALQKYHPHQTITITLQRGDSMLQRTLTLGERKEVKSTHPADMFEGGKSSRRDGFTRVWFSDAHVRSTDCGAPVFDEQGRFSGMVIARFSRTATVILHASDIMAWTALL